MLHSLQKWNQMDTDSIQLGVLNHLKYGLLKDQFNYSKQDSFLALARTVRDRLVDRWIQTKQTYHQKQAKRVYYLSLEYLIGRSLLNNMINLEIEKVCKEAVEQLGLDFTILLEEEPDAGLGNGGLGRLAACFLDSLTTLEIPAVGYGLRYDYGIFHQKIVDGYQIEKPDSWLNHVHPWEVCRPEYRVPVHFGGRVETYQKNGKVLHRWVETSTIIGIPYDVPVTGYQTSNINTLRLWSARANTDFDLQNFNQGSYTRAVEEKTEAENITKVLYPNDNIYEGRELRFKQQYFFAACSVFDILRRFVYEKNEDFRQLHEKAAIQLNDTHPAFAILELMRILIDEKELAWEHAWEVSQACFGYTNHTLLPEALEKWPLEIFEKLLPRHLQIIYEINHFFLSECATRFPALKNELEYLSLIEEKPIRQVRMAYLSVVGSHSINGVSALHTTLLKETLLKSFYHLFPERFNNKTNGVTPRRWLILCNPLLTELINETIGTTWHKDLERLKDLIPYATNEAFQKRFREVKQKNKQHLVETIWKRNRIPLQVSSLFDVQIKRLHEYKRQFLNLLHIVILYNRLQKNPKLEIVPRTFIFGAKAAPGYAIAKKIIKLINDVARVINQDPTVHQKLKIVFLENYEVSLAEQIIPAADLSEQISTAGMEASGTGNMKLTLNGALTIGTLDGANVEILEEVGAENIFIFGLNTEEVSQLRESGSYFPENIYKNNPEIQEAIDLIFSKHFNLEEADLYQPLYDLLFRKGDHFLHLADLESYIRCQAQVDLLYQNPQEWTKKAILNVACSGKFSSDRTISEYGKEIWKIKSVPVHLKIP
jgi:starch phosphorylase